MLHIAGDIVLVLVSFRILMQDVVIFFREKKAEMREQKKRKAQKKKERLQVGLQKQTISYMYELATL